MNTAKHNEMRAEPVQTVSAAGQVRRMQELTQLKVT